MKLRILVVCFAALILSSCSAKQKRCYAKTETSFATFLDDEWRDYCEEYVSFTEDPVSQDLLDVTIFITEHAERSDEIRSKILRYDKVDSCFSSGKEQLEYRRLKECVKDNAETQLTLIDAWKTAVDPFLEDIQLTVGSTKPRLREADKTAQYLSEKAKEALRLSKKTDRKRLDEFQELVEVTAEDVSKLNDSVDAYDEILEAAEGNDTLTEELEGDVSKQVEKIRKNITAQNEKIEELRYVSGYLQIVEDTAGNRCPNIGVAQIKETKIAISTMRSYFEQIESGRVRIDKKTSSSKKDGKKIESFSGYACGLRKEEDQFPGTAALCTQHTFTIQRKKSGRRWGSWEAKEVKEGDLDSGIDCRLVD